MLPAVDICTFHSLVSDAIFIFKTDIFYIFFSKCVFACLSERLVKNYGLILIKSWWKTAALAKGEPINFQSGSGQCFPIYNIELYHYSQC